MLNKVNLEVNNFGIINHLNNYQLMPGESIKRSGTQAADIIYVTNGKYHYLDNLGNEFNLGRGEVQAINGSTEIEYTISNVGDKPLTFIQIEVTTDGSKTAISSEAHKYKWKLRINQWFEVVSNIYGEAQVRINQDLKIHVLMLNNAEVEGFAVDSNRQAYLIQLEGDSDINGHNLVAGEGLQIIGEDIMITANESSHFLVVEMAK